MSNFLIYKFLFLEIIENLDNYLNESVWDKSCHKNTQKMLKLFTWMMRSKCYLSSSYTNLTFQVSAVDFTFIFWSACVFVWSRFDFICRHSTSQIYQSSSYIHVEYAWDFIRKYILEQTLWCAIILNILSQKQAFHVDN